MDAFISGAKAKEARIAKQSKTTEGAAVPWVEKYRPRKVDDIAYQDDVVAVLKKCVSGSDIPNLLFYGPPGTGKTSSALAVCREIFGADGYRGRVLEMNASDERGIQVVRSKIKEFARLAVGTTRSDGKPCPALKIIVLDEADSMTGAAQAALRRTMEKESKTTRFFLICNYISRIIDPLTSRCAKFRFKPLAADVQKRRLSEICQKENVDIADDALDALIRVCEGDLRKSITYLQSAAVSFRGATVQVGDVDRMVGVISDDAVHLLIKACRTGKFENVQTAVESLRRDGFPAYQLLSQVFDIVVVDDELNDDHKAAICDKLGVCEYRLLDGADEFLQLMDLGCTILAQYKTVNA
uniref:AAA+ ATPase domain-containing protein n=1 Tax=Plectus sambesii TaxID=2011161 RepID=A0A914VZV7_9BILA